VLETINRVLEYSDRPMRAREIYAAAEELLGEPLVWKSVKETLWNYTSGDRRRFTRVSRGLYKLHTPQSSPTGKSTADAPLFRRTDAKSG
jgi:hypothetical protein